MTAVPSDATHLPPDPAVAAEAYASLGWRVVPIAPGRKYPQIAEWQKAATDNLEVIRSWYGGICRGHGVGIATGEGTGLWVLDVDITDGKTGAQALAQLQADHGDLPPTVMAITGTGGLHLFYQWDPARPVTNGMATRLPPGLDIRGEGGQVVAAPTLHPTTGQPYAWAAGRDPWSMTVAAAPDWLYQLLFEPLNQSSRVPTDEAKVTEGRLETAATSSPVLPSGPGGEDSIAEWFNRHHPLVDLLIADGWTEHSTHGDDTWWTRPGKDRRDGHSAVLHGGDVLVIFTTEISVELAMAGKATADGSGVTVNSFYYWAGTRHHGDRSQAAREARRERQRIEDPTGLLPAGNTTTGPGAPLAAVPDPPVVRLLNVDDILRLQPPPPLVGDWLDAGMLFTIPGKYGSLKSFVALSMCLSVATTRPWLTQTIHHTGPAIYCSLEGSYTLKPRVAGWLEHNDRDDAPGFWAYDQRLNLLDPASVAAFLPVLDDLKPPLVIIDTLSKATPGAEENSKPDVSRAYQALDEFRRVTGGSVGVIHHTGHNATGRGRGFSGFEDDLDVVLAIEGQWKDGPVRLVSQKQKARENPPPIWLSLTPTATGHPVVVPTIDPGDEGADAVDSLIDEVVDLVTASPGQSKSKIVDAMSSAARWRKLKAIDRAIESGLIRFEYGSNNSQRLHPNV